MTIVYLVRHKETGLYSDSEDTTNLLDDAQIFKTFGAAKARITNMGKSKYYDHTSKEYLSKYNVNDLEVVAFELILKELSE